MSAPGRWIRLNVGFHRSEWLAGLSMGARFAWVHLLAYVKSEGVRGEVKSLAPRVASALWEIPTRDVSAMLNAARADGAIVGENGTWKVSNWRAYQGEDHTAAERQKRHRDRLAGG